MQASMFQAYFVRYSFLSPTSRFQKATLTKISKSLNLTFLEL